jgi:hypothetical protein
MENKTQQEYKVWWDEENKIGRIYIIGEVNEEMITPLIKEASLIADRHGKQIGWLIDLTKITKSLLSLKVRKIMTDAMKLVSRGHIAVIGMSTLIKVVLGFVIKATNRKDIKINFFSTEEEALKWLKEE